MRLLKMETTHNQFKLTDDKPFKTISTCPTRQRIEMPKFNAKDSSNKIEESSSLYKRERVCKLILYTWYNLYALTCTCPECRVSWVQIPLIFIFSLPQVSVFLSFFLSSQVLSCIMTVPKISKPLWLLNFISHCSS